jgi:Zn-finger nucleic acid-binding protein
MQITPVDTVSNGLYTNNRGYDMFCPKDHSSMIVVEWQQIALDYCPECRGVWFDSGELELILERVCLDGAGLCLADLYHRPEAKTMEKSRKCPICRDKMHKSRLGAAPQIMIDACHRGDGLWFDGSELHLLMTQLKSKPAADGSAEDKMLSFMGEVLRADL